MAVIFVLLASLGPQTIARITIPERTQAMGSFQLIVFSWIISFMLLLGLAIFVILMTCMVKPLNFIRNTLMPAEVIFIQPS